MKYIVQRRPSKNQKGSIHERRRLESEKGKILKEIDIIKKECPEAYAIWKKQQKIKDKS